MTDREKRKLRICNNNENSKLQSFVMQMMIG